MTPNNCFAAITGWGMAVPPRVLTNSDLEQIVETSDEWIRSRTGVIERHVLSEGEKPSQLGAQAAKEALEKAGLDVGEVDTIVVTTCTGDRSIPATANSVQHLLGNDTAAAFDVNGGCVGFIYGLQIATSMISTGAAERALVVAAEGLTRFTDYTDRSTCVLFGDGGGAIVLEPSSREEGCLASKFSSDASAIELLTVPGGMAERPASHDTVDSRLHYLKMEGAEVFRRAVVGMEQTVRALLDETKTSLDEIQLVVPHQANKRIIDALAKRLELSHDKVVCNIERYGNTSSATIPIALAEAVSEGRLDKGDLVLLVAFGAGLSVGSALVRW
ncbi:MAG: 3-oxoacyl-ACP synthase [Acidimicrobiia bacterium]|mgnify:CR=1 FL=1